MIRANASFSSLLFIGSFGPIDFGAGSKLVPAFVVAVIVDAHRVATRSYRVAPDHRVPPNHAVAAHGGAAPNHRVAPNHRRAAQQAIAPDDRVPPDHRVAPNRRGIG